MSSAPSPCSARLHQLLTQAGVIRWAVVPCGPVESWAVELFDRFLAEGRHGEMHFMERYGQVRNDSRLLLEGGASHIIVCAIPYWNAKSNPLFSQHSQGQDYHYVIKQRLPGVLMAMGWEGRVCVDSAPVRERYWAQRAGLGVIGLNNQLIIPGLGSYFFLTEIVVKQNLSDLCPPALHAVSDSCLKCGRCVEACPGKALNGNGGIDARRCHSYLTIEAGEKVPETIFGCDICQRVCPMNSSPLPTTIPELAPSEEMLNLTRRKFDEMSYADQKRFFRQSPVLRSLSRISRL